MLGLRVFWCCLVNREFLSCLEPLSQSETWCTNEINLHVSEISFSYHRMSTMTSFEEEAKGNSEVVYLKTCIVSVFARLGNWQQLKREFFSLFKSIGVCLCLSYRKQMNRHRSVSTRAQ